MAGALGVVERVSIWMQAVSATALTFILLLTVADVALRLFGHPIVGTYEIVGLAGAVVIGFAIPITSWMRGHIFVDFFYQKCSKNVQYWLNIATRLIGVAVFVVLGWQLFALAYDLLSSGEVTLTRRLPFYPIAYGLGLACFVECLVLITDIVKIIGGRYE